MKIFTNKIRIYPRSPRKVGITVWGVMALVMVASSAQAMSTKDMKQPGSAIKWREMDLTLRNDIITDYIMNVAVPSGDIDQATIGECMMQELKPYAKLQPQDKKGPAFFELMKKCVK